MKNWKTSLVGVIGAVLAVVWPLIETGEVGVKEIAIAAILAALGYFSKDAGVSGTDK